jgi:hypothetical protein
LKLRRKVDARRAAPILATMPEFHGTIDDLKAGVEATGIDGVWSENLMPAGNSPQRIAPA